MTKILLIGTGGTIGCVRDGSIRLDAPFRILDYVDNGCARFDCASPFNVLSENMDFELWRQLIDFISAVDFNEYDGVIILHGSDTLAFTAALVGNMFYGKPIVLTASDKPLGEDGANGIGNFTAAVNYIKNGGSRVFVSYNGMRCAEPAKPIENPVLQNKKIIVIYPCVGIDYGCFSLDGVDAVLHMMYHSATVPRAARNFAERCRNAGVPLYFVTENASADYESAEGLENIIFSSTVEDAYVRLLLAK